MGGAAAGRRRMSRDDRRAVIRDAATEAFAECGYRGASIDAIARRAGVTPPVVYDHFPSKQALHEDLIEHHYAELRALWFNHADPTRPVSEWFPGAIDAWFGYIQSRPYAGRLLFRDTTGDPQIEAAHRAIQDRSRAELLPLLARQLGETDAAAPAVGMAWEGMRAVLQGLALWWYDHPEVEQGDVVAAAMNSIWLGYERVFAGERWESAPSGRRRRVAERSTVRRRRTR